VNDLLRAGIDAAIYINLDERKDKKIAMEKMFKRLNIEVERFPAVRASKPLYTNHRTPFLGNKREQALPRSGCDQSHWTVLTELWKRDVDCALVFEDDVVLPDNFVDGVIRIQKQLPEGWWAVRLGWHDGLGKKVLEETGKNVGKIQKPCCTNSILYSKEGIEQIRGRLMLPYGIIEETFWLLESEGKYPIYAALPVPLTGISDLTSDITGKVPFKGRMNMEKVKVRKAIPRLPFIKRASS
jgi:GR25 family glycosyltransferase involved in LPS biosynthesis